MTVTNVLHFGLQALTCANIKFIVVWDTTHVQYRYARLKSVIFQKNVLSFSASSCLCSCVFFQFQLT
jgi:hypothetical protein